MGVSQLWRYAHWFGNTTANRYNKIRNNRRRPASCRLRCRVSGKDLGKPEDKEWNIPYASELRPESFYFGIKGLCRCISVTVVEVVQDSLVLIHKRL